MLVAAVMVFAFVYLLVIFLWGTFMDPFWYAVQYENKFLPPGKDHLFGTDFMGRDMFYRCIKGLSNSLVIGEIGRAHV